MGRSGRRPAFRRRLPFPIARRRRSRRGAEPERNRSDVTKPKSPLDVLRQLDGSNCRECGQPTCMAFAAAVFQGRRHLADCPKLDREAAGRLGAGITAGVALEEHAAQTLGELRRRIAAIDLATAAERLGAPFVDGRLVLRCLGKTVAVAVDGSLVTDIHVNPWLAAPVFDHVLRGSGTRPTGRWVHFRDLPNGRTWQPLFGRRCEQACKKLADADPDFFDLLIRMFAARQVENHYRSDVSLVLQPLPLVPMLICYWKPGGGLESDLNLFFDAAAEDNLAIELLFRLATGLVMMLEKLARSHGGQDSSATPGAGG